MGCASSAVRPIEQPTSDETSSVERREPPTPTSAARNTDEAGIISNARGDVDAPSIPLRTQASSLVDERNLVLIIWDIENIRLPEYTERGLSPTDVVGYLKKRYITDQNRTEYRTFAAVTEKSLEQIEKQHKNFRQEMLPHVSVLMADKGFDGGGPGGGRGGPRGGRGGPRGGRGGPRGANKRDADMVLKREMQSFITEYSHLARSRKGACTIVLLSGDEDYLVPVTGALGANFSVELIHHDSASRALMAQSYSSPPMLWSHFLQECSGVQDITLPFDDNRLMRYLSRGGALVTGYKMGEENPFKKAEDDVNSKIRAAGRRHSPLNDPYVVKSVHPSRGLVGGGKLGVTVSPKRGTWNESQARAAAAELLRKGLQGVIGAHQVTRVSLQASARWVPGRDGSDRGGGAASTSSPSLPKPKACGRSMYERVIGACQSLDTSMSSAEQLLCREDKQGPNKLARVMLYAFGQSNAKELVARHAEQLKREHGVKLRVRGLLEAHDDDDDDDVSDDGEGDPQPDESDDSEPEVEPPNVVPDNNRPRPRPPDVPRGPVAPRRRGRERQGGLDRSGSGEYDSDTEH